MCGALLRLNIQNDIYLFDCYCSTGHIIKRKVIFAITIAMRVLENPALRDLVMPMAEDNPVNAKKYIQSSRK